MRSVALSLIALAACSSGGDKVDRERAADRPLPTPPEQAAAPKSSAERMFPPSTGGIGAAAPTPLPPGAPAQTPYATLTPAWSEVRTDSNCFYFSGPDGRDDRLTGSVNVERDGQHVKLRIGDAVFTGSYIAGALDVERRTRHNFDGPWSVLETIRGRYLDGVMVAAYHYSECAQSAACPGHCTIDAKLTFVRQR